MLSTSRRTPIGRLPLTILLLVSGCALVDQTTFAPSPEAKAQEAVVRPPPQIDARTPLVTIDYETANPNYREMLGYAVRAAEARSHAVQYDVVAFVKSAGDATQGTDRATEVMRAIIAERVPEGRVHLGLRMDPAIPAGQVRVYVR